MGVLPEQFAELERLSDWAGRNETERVARRRSASAEQLRSFYDLMKPQLEAVLMHLDNFTLDDMPAAETKLLYLTLMMVEVAVAVEKYDAVGSVPFAIAPQQFAPVLETD